MYWVSAFLYNYFFCKFLPLILENKYFIIPGSKQSMTINPFNEKKRKKTKQNQRNLADRGLLSSNFNCSQRYIRIN